MVKLLILRDINAYLVSFWTWVNTALIYSLRNRHCFEKMSKLFKLDQSMVTTIVMLKMHVIRGVL